MTAVLAHELAHTVQWKKMFLDSTRLSYSLLAQIRFKTKKKFESNADRISIQRGLSVGHSYTEGLISYRLTNLANTPEHEVDYLRRLYNFEEELIEITDELSSTP